MCIVNNCKKYHLSVVRILKQYGLPYRKKYGDVIRNIFKRFNFDYEKEGNQYHKKYFFDETFFDIIDKKKKAYWLGFLYADGYILNNKNTFGCALKASDVDHLKKFLKDVKVEGDPLKYDHNTNSNKFQLTSEHTVNTLIQHGFTNNKSYDQTDKPFLDCPDKYKKYFILGLWDGDGYVSISKENKNITGVVSNNEVLLNSIMKYINLEFGDGFCKISKSDGYPRIRFTHAKAKKFLDWLYDGAKVYLERKYNVYLKYKDGYYNQFPYHNIVKTSSGRFYVGFIAHNTKVNVGTFDTIMEAVEAYNIAAKQYNKPEQKYIGEILTKEEYKEYLDRSNKENI